MSYYGELIAFCTTLSWTIGIFPFTEAARRLGPSVVNHFRLLLACVFLTLILVLTPGLSISDIALYPSFDHWLWFGLSGIVGLALGDYFGFTSFAILGTRLGSIFATLAPGAALLFGFLILNEEINLIGIFGILITVGGISWLTLTKAEKAKVPDYGHGKVNKGILYGIIAAICQGIGLVFAKKGMSFITDNHSLAPIHATWIRMVIATAIIYLITIFRGNLKSINEPVLKNKNNGVLPAVAGTVFGPVVGVSFSMYAVSLINVSVAQTIFSLVPVCVLPIGYFIYKEKITYKAILGALIAIIGVIILIWRNEFFS